MLARSVRQSILTLDPAIYSDHVQQIYSNRDRVDELKGQVCALLVVMIAPHKGKGREEIPDDLQSDLEQLKASVTPQNIRLPLKSSLFQ